MGGLQVDQHLYLPLVQPVALLPDLKSDLMLLVLGVFLPVALQLDQHLSLPTDLHLDPPADQLTTKAKLGAPFLNAKEGTVLHTTLEEMGHPQPVMPLQQTDNSTPDGIINATCKEQH